MPGGNQAQVQIKENGFFDNTNEDKMFHQVMADVTRTDAANYPSIQLEGAPSRKEFISDTVDSGHDNNRLFTMTSNFYFYLMGVKGMSLEEAVSVVPGQKDYETHLKGFWKFLRDNPVKRTEKSEGKEPVTDEQKSEGKEPVTDEQKEKSLKNWADLYNNCTKAFSEYKLPDIDYSNPQEVAKHHHELYFLANIMQDYTQEMERFFKAFPYEARKASGEYDKLYDGADNFSSLQGFVEA